MGDSSLIIKTSSKYSYHKMHLTNVIYFKASEDCNKMSNQSKKAALTQTTEEYASRSSIHGISYIFDRELKIADRLLWLLVVIAFAGVAAALTWNFWTQWRNEQVITNRRHRVGW